MGECLIINNPFNISALLIYDIMLLFVTHRASKKKNPGQIANGYLANGRLANGNLVNGHLANIQITGKTGTSYASDL